MKFAFLLLATVSALSFGQQSIEENQTPKNKVEIHYSNRHFEPTKISVAADKEITIRVINNSGERIEFESFRLHREKVVEAGATLVLHLPPLKPGTYDFFDDFHEDVPEGQLVVR